jgi:hypothetical protein
MKRSDSSTSSTGSSPVKRYITPSDLARKAGVTPWTARIWCIRYHLGSKIGGRFRVDPAAADKFLGEWGQADEAGAATDDAK